MHSIETTVYNTLFKQLPKENIKWFETKVSTFKTKDRLLQRITALNPPQQCQNINVLVIGNLGSGKSSLVNTFLTSLRNSGQIANIATTYQANIQSTTCKVIFYPFNLTRKMFSKNLLETDVQNFRAVNHMQIFLKEYLYNKFMVTLRSFLSLKKFSNNSQFFFSNFKMFCLTPTFKLKCVRAKYTRCLYLFTVFWRNNSINLAQSSCHIVYDVTFLSILSM